MIYVILGAPALAYLLILSYQWHLRFPILNRKPFSCVVCLSAWLGVLLFFMPAVVQMGVAAFSLSGIVGKIIYKNVD